MILKYLILALSPFAFNRGESAVDRANNPIESIKKALRDEVSALVLKSLLGVLVVSIVVFSIIQVAKAIQILLSQFENGFLYELVGFSVVAAIGSIMLYHLFKDSSKDSASISVEVRAPQSEFKLQNLGLKFFDGIKEGLASRDHIQSQVINSRSVIRIAP